MLSLTGLFVDSKCWACELKSGQVRHLKWKVSFNLTCHVGIAATGQYLPLMFPSNHLHLCKQAVTNCHQVNKKTFNYFSGVCDKVTHAFNLLHCTSLQLASSSPQFMEVLRRSTLLLSRPPYCAAQTFGSLCELAGPATKGVKEGSTSKRVVLPLYTPPPFGTVEIIVLAWNGQQVWLLGCPKQWGYSLCFACAFCFERALERALVD